MVLLLQPHWPDTTIFGHPYFTPNLCQHLTKHKQAEHFQSVNISSNINFLSLNAGIGTKFKTIRCWLKTNIIDQALNETILD